MSKLKYSITEAINYRFSRGYLISTPIDDRENRKLFNYFLNQLNYPEKHTSVVNAILDEGRFNKFEQIVKEYNERIDHDEQFKQKFNGMINE